MSLLQGITLAGTGFGADDPATTESTEAAGVSAAGYADYKARLAAGGLTPLQIKKDWNVMYWIGGLLGISMIGMLAAARAEGRRQHG